MMVSRGFPAAVNDQGRARHVATVEVCRIPQSKTSLPDARWSDLILRGINPTAYHRSSIREKCTKQKCRTPLRSLSSLLFETSEPCRLCAPNEPRHGKEQDVNREAKLIAILRRLLA